MTQDLVSSVPGIFAALEGLLKAAGEAYDPQIPVFSFALGQYEPAGYVLISEIKQQPYEWEMIGSFTQKEIYEICGTAATFTGEVPYDTPGLAQRVVEETYALFQAVVMTPVMSHRDMPLLDTAGPSPYLMLPWESSPQFKPAKMADGTAGWGGVIEWSFHFEALLTPAEP